jgi:hypothetical protein
LESLPEIFESGVSACRLRQVHDKLDKVENYAVEACDFTS